MASGVAGAEEGEGADGRCRQTESPVWPPVSQRLAGLQHSVQGDGKWHRIHMHGIHSSLVMAGVRMTDFGIVQ